MQDFRKLNVWHDAKEVAKKIYLITQKFPDDEKFSMISQLRRAALSIGANIAEGCSRHTNKEFSRFLYTSLGSANECLHFLILSRELNYLNETEFSEVNEHLDKTARKINSFIKALETNINGERRILNVNDNRRSKIE